MGDGWRFLSWSYGSSILKGTREPIMTLEALNWMILIQMGQCHEMGCMSDELESSEGEKESVQRSEENVRWRAISVEDATTFRGFEKREISYPRLIRSALALSSTNNLEAVPSLPTVRHPRICNSKKNTSSSSSTHLLRFDHGRYSSLLMNEVCWRIPCFRESDMDKTDINVIVPGGLKEHYVCGLMFL